MTAQVYRTLVERAVEALQAGHAVIADAVFGRAWQRAAIAEAARTAGVRFTGLWLEAPVDVMSAWVQARSDDASDATVAVLQGNRWLADALHCAQPLWE